MYHINSVRDVTRDFAHSVCVHASCFELLNCACLFKRRMSYYANWYSSIEDRGFKHSDQQNFNL